VLRYAGEYWDDTTGLQYLRARWYDPGTARFMGEDTYQGEISNPQSLNGYAYVANNPLIYVDPSGHYFETIDYQELRILLNEARLKSGSSKNQNYQLYKDFIRKRYDFVSIYGGANQYNYLYDLLTGTSDYKNSSGKSDWAKDQLLSAYQKWTDAEVLGIAAMGMISDVNFSGKGKYSGKVKSGKCNCFTAGTKVQTDEGEKPIEEIEVGEKVLAKSDETGEVAYKEVVGLFQKQADEIYYVHIGDEIIEVTGEHPFWLDGKGWTFVKDLKAGDLLVSSDGSKLAIDKIEKEPRKATVYNFEVKDFNSYFVSNLGVWVHNCSVLRYALKSQDLDWRGAGKSWRDAVNLAFSKTGVDKSGFTATKWAKNVNGKSFPVEWRSKNGAEVSIDYAHYGVDRNGNWASGPDAPHVGWQTPGKKNTVGHIIIDSVPFGRPANK
jgi:RHS repeat-associated protein